MHITAQGRARTKNTKFTHQVNYHLVIIIIMYLVTIYTAVAVIYNQHEQRKLFSESQQQLRMEEELRLEQGQLLLEHAALASNTRVEKIAAKKLDMHTPLAKDIKVIKLNAN